MDFTTLHPYFERHLYVIYAHFNKKFKQYISIKNTKRIWFSHLRLPINNSYSSSKIKNKQINSGADSPQSVSFVMVRITVERGLGGTAIGLATTKAQGSTQRPQSWRIPDGLRRSTSVKLAAQNGRAKEWVLLRSESQLKERYDLTELHLFTSANLPICLCTIVAFL